MGLPVEVNNLMIGSLGGYTVGRSLRFRSSASAYLSRAPATATNRTTFTLSAWVKRGKLGGSSLQSIFGNANGVNLAFYFGFSSNDVIDLHQYDNGTNVLNILTTPVYRDPSAWYHILASVDTTQATASNRAKVYVNGIEVTALGTATYPTQNYSLTWNQTNTHVIGSGYNGASPTGFLFDGYLAEVYNIDGQALTPSSFGAYDTNGVWQPKKYSGTYGTNGFYLPFSNTTSTTTLVQDSSGNGNNWTPNNISLTAGTTYDSMIDSPTNAAGTSTGIGNYCVINPLDFQNANTYSNANLSVSLAATTASLAFGTMGVSSGKWYWEVKTNAGANPMLGVATQAGTLSSRYFTGANSVYYYGNSGNKYVAGTGSAYGATYTTTDTIGIALDMDGSTITFYKNNVSQGAISLPSSLIGQVVVPAFTSGTGTAAQGMDVTFGQRPFAYTPPSGYKALNTYNLPAPSIANGAQYMAATTYTGNGSTLAVSNGANNTIGTTFQPDFVWMKSRSNAYNNILQDSVRGAGKNLQSNTTNAETGNSGDLLTSFNSNGFTVNNTYLGGTDPSTDGSGATYVGWQWKGGGTGVTNNSGTITSQVSANTSAGISIITYTGSGANATVGHGLGVAPQFYITKSRSSYTNSNWCVYHESIGASSYGILNSTSAFGSASTIWNNTAPTSSVFSLGSSAQTNNSGLGFVAYCFSAVRGYSAFGSYTGNGSADGPFVFTGFRPRFVLVKNANDATGRWIINDSSRSVYNQTANSLYADITNAEDTSHPFDFLSNGFKLRSSAAHSNGSGNTIIYAAFAENPLNYSRAR